MQLPEEFIEYTKTLFGEERWKKFVNSFNEEQPVSIRLNPFKSNTQHPTPNTPTPSLLERVGVGPLHSSLYKVPWCRNGYWLPKRPDFTLDPLLHAGCYYVQEAGSMFLDQILRQIISPDSSLNTQHPTPNTQHFSLSFGEGRGEASSLQALDLCAAPGGKSTLLRAALPEGALLYSNEPDHRRANILMENMQKQGHPDVIVTNNYAKDYQKAKLLFDLILTDVPCSGEGMFRKDEGAIHEWSIQNVMKCQALQRSIVQDIWPCLKEGGILIYSTCTFNTRENEENVRWICEELGAEVLPVSIQEEWKITGSLLDGFNQPVYRFIPGITPTEGLFVFLIRKTSDNVLSGKSNSKALRILSNGHYEGEIKGKNIIPAHAEALLINLPEGKYPRTEVDLETALHYLRGEAIYSPLLAEERQGIRLLTYQGHPLGFVKNLGNRANNLYPQEWRIRKSI